jgi:tetratricopeptide (TPR) repeat protein
MAKIKFKIVYLYGIVFITVILVLIITSQSGSNLSTDKSSIRSEEIPQDSIHQNLGMETPNSSNVNKDVIIKLKEMKILANALPIDTMKNREYADFLVAAHKPAEAVNYYYKILKIDNKRKDILLSLTQAYYIKNDLDSAENITKKILQFFPGDQQATYNLGAIEATKGNKDKAREIWNQLIIDHPNTETAELAKEALNKL